MENISNIGIILELKDLGVNFITIEYSGSGDSGCIDDITYHNKVNEVVTIEKDYEQLHQKLEKYVYNLLETIEDWYNNDGGYGVVGMDLINNTYEIENHIYIKETEDYYHEGNLIQE